MASPIAVIYDPVTLVVAMVVIPDQDDPRGENQLDDPAFNPKGMAHARIEKAAFDKQDLASMVKAVPNEVALQATALKSAIELGIVSAKVDQPQPKSADQIKAEAAIARSANPALLAQKFLFEGVKLEDAVALVGEKAVLADDAQADAIAP